MLATHYVALHDAKPNDTDVCTGWLGGFDASRRMLCTVGQAVEELHAKGVTSGVLCALKLGTFVRHHPSSQRRNPKVTGQVRGVVDGEIQVEWKGTGPDTMSIYLVELCDPPTEPAPRKRARSARQ